MDYTYIFGYFYGSCNRIFVRLIKFHMEHEDIEIEWSLILVLHATLVRVIECYTIFQADEKALNFLICLFLFCRPDLILQSYSTSKGDGFIDRE